MLALVPHAAPTSDRLHLWAGVADVAAVPPLTWKIDGRVVAPTVRRPLGRLLANGDTTVDTGFFEFSGLAPATVYEVELAAGGERIVRRTRTLPADIPSGPQDRFNVLLLSCFHRLEDKAGTAGHVLSRLKVKADLTLFAGDQVYLDLPTLRNFSDDEQWLRNKFQNDYLDNWFGNRVAPGDPSEVPAGFPRVLSLAPAAFMPDDHEFWNNFPFWASVVQNSWTEGGRRRWKNAAVASYQAFQQTAAVAYGAARAIDVGPLSILLLDTRSQRPSLSRERAGDLLGAKGREALTTWVDGLVASAATATPRYGMLVTGQSLFAAAAGEHGKYVDYEYADYPPDYRFMVEQVERVTAAGLSLLLATGDVHWGRVVEARSPAAGGTSVFELICSPTSLVSTVGADEVKRIWGAITGLFGSRDPWPRHADPDSPQPRFGSAKQYALQVVERTDHKSAVMRGNQAFMLRFSRAGAGLDVEVTCYPLSTDDTFNAAEQWSARLELRSRG